MYHFSFQHSSHIVFHAKASRSGLHNGNSPWYTHTAAVSGMFIVRGTYSRDAPVSAHVLAIVISSVSWITPRGNVILTRDTRCQFVLLARMAPVWRWSTNWYENREGSTLGSHAMGTHVGGPNGPAANEALCSNCIVCPLIAGSALFAKWNSRNGRARI